MSQLVAGLLLTVASIGALIACLPRKGKTVWFAKMPFLASGVPILMIAVFAMGVILIVAHFSTIDETTLVGTATHS